MAIHVVAPTDVIVSAEAFRKYQDEWQKTYLGVVGTPSLEEFIRTKQAETMQRLGKLWEAAVDITPIYENPNKDKKA